jgi:hypothetical protein
VTSTSTAAGAGPLDSFFITWSRCSSWSALVKDHVVSYRSRFDNVVRTFSNIDVSGTSGGTDSACNSSSFATAAWIQAADIADGALAITGSLLDGTAQAPELVGFAEHPGPVTFLLKGPVRAHV